MMQPHIILAALSPAERMAGLGGSKEWYVQPLVSWTVWLPVLLAASAGVVLIYLYRRWQGERQALKGFIEAADRLRLSHEERSLLARAGMAAGLKRLDSVFSVASALDRGAARLLAGRDAAALSEAGRAHVEAIFDSLRIKLGFVDGGDLPDEPVTAPAGTTIALAVGARVTVSRLTSPAQIAAVVVEAADGQVAVQTEKAVSEFRVGEAWRVRYVLNSQQWEFDASMMDGMGQRLLLRLIGSPRGVNLRRFARVPTHKAAYLALFPFSTSPQGQDLPDFVAGTLTEIAGPGLRIDSALKTALGDRVLVIVKTQDDRIVQGIGVVRRSVEGSGGIRITVAEMIGLTDAEVGQLVTETNLAARLADVDAEDKEEALIGPPQEKA